MASAAARGGACEEVAHARARRVLLNGDAAKPLTYSETERRCR
jgi:hypothetical protein